MSCLSKLFNMVINNRLVDVFDKQIKPQQFGFKKNSRTSDGVFVLKSLVNKYVNNKKQKVFGCFVDLKKAFDSVWRSGLLYKIIKNENVGNIFYNIIKNMYRQTEVAVKSKDNLSDYVCIDRGVKQGDNLSPIYLIYI